MSQRTDLKPDTGLQLVKLCFVSCRLYISLPHISLYFDDGNCIFLPLLQKQKASKIDELIESSVKEMISLMVAKVCKKNGSNFWPIM